MRDTLDLWEEECEGLWAKGTVRAATEEALSDAFAWGEYEAVSDAVFGHSPLESVYYVNQWIEYMKNCTVAPFVVTAPRSEDAEKAPLAQKIVNHVMRNASFPLRKETKPMHYDVKKKSLWRVTNAPQPKDLYGHPYDCEVFVIAHTPEEALEGGRTLIEASIESFVREDVLVHEGEKVNTSSVLAQHATNFVVRFVSQDVKVV